MNSVEAYEKKLITTRIDNMINEAGNKFITNGKLMDVMDVLSTLRIKHFG